MASGARGLIALVCAYVLVCFAGCGGSGSGSTGGGTQVAPSVRSVSPTSVVAGSSATTLTVAGSGFTTSSVVEIGGVAELTTFVSSTELTAVVPTSQLATGATLDVIVTNGGLSSSPGSATLVVNNPSPTISQVSPSSVTLGAGSTSIVITGTGFIVSTSVQVNGSARTTSYSSATQISALLTTADLATAGTLSITAMNPAPMGGTSPSASFVVNNPVPGTISLNPSSLTAGAASPTTVTVIGSNFVPGAVAQVNGANRTTTYVSATQVTFQLAVADQTVGAALNVSVVNPAPGGGVSGIATLTVSNPVPQVSSLSPQVVITGVNTPNTVTLNGSNFTPTSTVQIGGTSRPTTYVSPTQLTFQLLASDQTSPANLSVGVVNPAPGGGTSAAVTLIVANPTATPAISSISPTQIVVNSSATLISIQGTGFTALSTVLWNQTTIPSSLGYCLNGATYVTCLKATVPASLLTTVASVTVTVNTPTATPAVSNAVTVNITDPPVPTLTSISVSAGPVNTGATIGVIGAGFTSQSVVTFNGTAVPTMFVSSTSLTANVPASSTSMTGVYPVSVTTPAPGGGTSANIYFTVYVSIPNNSMVYDPANGLFYLSVPSAAGTPYGNSIVSVDPVTGALGMPIPVGSEPNRMAITSDGRYIWVALDGAAAVQRVDLNTNTVGTPFAIGASGNSVETVSALAALPGSPDSVVVATYYGGYTTPTGYTLSIYDSGVQRSSVINFATYAPFPWAMIVDGTRNEIYGPGQVNPGTYITYSYDASGIAVKSTTTSSLYYASNNMDDVSIVAGRLYTSYGQADDPETGALLGTFYSSGTTAAQGSITVDSTLGKVFILEGSGSAFNSSGFGTATAQLAAFNTADFTATSSVPIPVTIPLFRTSYQWAGPTGARLTRWGSDGLAFRGTGGFVSLRSTLVQDLSSVSADLAVTLAVSGSGTTGTNTAYTATITNNGPAAATGVGLDALTPSSGVLTSVTSSTGSCSSTPTVCDLGTLANGASATVTFNVLQTTAGSSAMTVQISGSETDPVGANNQATASATITGSAYNLTPSLATVSPAAIASGSSDTVITLNGAGFSSASAVMLNGSPLNTSYLSATQLTAIVPAANLSSLGWAAITVSNPSPGGGVSGSVPLTVFAVLPINATDIVYDPYSRNIMAGIGTGTSSLLGNSLVAITPDTVALSSPVSLGATPSRLTLSSDGQLLYALLPGSSTGSIAGFNMLTQQLSFTIPGFQATGYNTGLRDIAVQPGADDTVAVDEGEYPGTSIFDINPTAMTATRRGAATGTYTGTCLLFPNASSLFVTDLYVSGVFLKIYSVTANGLVNGSSPYYVGDSLQAMGCYKADGNLLVGQAGGVASLTSTLPVQTGVFEGQAMLGNYGAGARDFVPDASLGLSFLQPDPNGYSANLNTILSFNLQTFMQTNSLTVPFSSFEPPNGGIGLEMVRWGQDGLAILSSGGNVYLLRGPAIVPQLLATDSAATLTSSSITTINHGVGNTLLTLTGSNFLPGVAVSWNGSYRTTSIISSTQITVAIPASDLASTGTASLVATNPGAPGSTPITITVQ